MYCTSCGQDLPDDARFCSRCGAPTSAEQAEPGGDATTKAIEAGVLDEETPFGDVPDLEPGTAMLVVVRGPNAGSRYLVDRDVTTVGRHPDSHLFLDDVTVSRRHAEVVRRADDLAVRDLGSLNGTYVNGDRVEERVLRSGDEVQIGRFKLLFVGAGR
jgi:pSer/pThr/pTyr-binding forkhead associated (FHA) protein